MVWSHPGHLCVYGKLFFNVAAVGADDFLIPVEGILLVAVERAAVLVAVNIDEAVTLFKALAGAQHVHSPAHELVSARNALRKTAAARYPFGGIRKRSKLSANKFKYKMKASRYRKTIPKGFHIFV